MADLIYRVRDLTQSLDGADNAAAVELARHGTTLLPLDWRIWMAYGRAALRLPDYGQAQTAFERVLALTAGKSVDAWTGLAIVRQRLGDGAGALEAAERGAALDPGSAAAQVTLADMRRGQGDLAGADVAYDRALWLRPGYPDARYNRSFLRFEQGRWTDAWRDYACRWDTGEYGVEQDLFRLFRVKRHGPRWGGAPLAPGTRLLVWAEQGAGDTLWALRYVDALLAEEPAADVILAVQPPVFRHVWRNYRDRCRVVRRDDGVPPWNLHIPMLNLPVALQCWEPRHAPARRLWPEHGDAVPWPGAARRVGIVWGGSLSHANDPRRSTGLGDWLPILRTPGVAFVSLQVGPRAAEAQELFDAGRLLDCRPWVRDFADTANLVAGLDLVIGVDTGTMHLAAGLDVPTWWLIGDNPDWRFAWPGSDATRTLWYGGARLWRKPAGQAWDGTIAAVAAALAGRLSSRSAAAA